MVFIVKCLFVVFGVTGFRLRHIQPYITPEIGPGLLITTLSQAEDWLTGTVTTSQVVPDISYT